MHIHTQYKDAWFFTQGFCSEQDQSSDLLKLMVWYSGKANNERPWRRDLETNGAWRGSGYEGELDGSERAGDEKRGDVLSTHANKLQGGPSPCRMKQLP